MEGDHCQLGGYENALLGYRTQHYDRFADHMDSIDVLMFGECSMDSAIAVTSTPCQVMWCMRWPVARN